MRLSNPERSTRGGDVTGDCMTDIEGGVGSPTSVAEASFDPGYKIELDYASEADLKRGFVTYGVGVGTKRRAGYL